MDCLLCSSSTGLGEVLLGTTCRWTLLPLSVVGVLLALRDCALLSDVSRSAWDWQQTKRAAIRRGTLAASSRLGGACSVSSPVHRATSELIAQQLADFASLLLEIITWAVVGA